MDFIKNKHNYSLNVTELPLHSDETVDVRIKIKNSIADINSEFDNRWDLKESFKINNEIFNNEFNEKRTLIQTYSPVFSHREIRYGFLATINKSIIHKIADEGLEVRCCPYNYFGHSICGIHISQNADICMKEAEDKARPDEEIILITFKYMLGRHKIVPMYDQDILLAPSPNFDSHLCEEHPDPKEKVCNQYVKSLVYLYEFANDQLDPIVRPRHCCPVSALVYKPTKNDIIENALMPYWNTINEEENLSFIKPLQQKHWGREFLFKDPSNNFESSINNKNDHDAKNDLLENILMPYWNSINEEENPSFLKPLQQKHWGREFPLTGASNNFESSIINKKDHDENRRAFKPNYNDKFPDERSLKFINDIELRNPLQRRSDYGIYQDYRNTTMPSYDDRVPDERSLKFIDKIEERDCIRRPFNNDINQDVRNRPGKFDIRTRRDFTDTNKQQYQSDFSEDFRKPQRLERERSFDRLQKCKEDARIREQPRELKGFESSNLTFEPKEHMSSLRKWFQ